MKDWIQRLDTIIRLNGRELLHHAGMISHEKALEKSETEFIRYKEEQKKLEHEQSLKELEMDITEFKAQNPDKDNF